MSFTDSEKRIIRTFVRDNFGFKKIYSVKTFVKKINDPTITEKNFYTKFNRFMNEMVDIFRAEEMAQRFEKESAKIQAREEKKKVRKAMEKAAREKKPRKVQLKKPATAIIDVTNNMLGSETESKQWCWSNLYLQTRTNVLQGGKYYFQLSIHYGKEKFAIKSEIVTIQDPKKAYLDIFGIINTEEVHGSDPIQVNWITRSTYQSPLSPAYPDYRKYLVEYGVPQSIAMSKIPNKFRLVVMRSEELPPKRIVQSFRDGNTHCVLQPMITMWEKMRDNSESTASQKRCGQIANKLRALLPEYEDGVPEDKMEEVAKIAGRCVVIYDLLQNESTFYNKSCNKYMYFTNTRQNHIDQGKLTLDDKPIRVDENIMYELKQDILNGSKWGVFMGNEKSKFQRSKCIKTPEGTYAVFNEDYDDYKAFNKFYGIDNYGLNAAKYPELNKFIKEGTIVHSAPVILGNDYNNIYECKQADISRAYTRFHETKYFKGFPAKITNWCKGKFTMEFVKQHVGFFKVKVVKCKNTLFKSLGLEVGKFYILPSVEIEYYHDNDVSFEVIGGCWGTKFDFDFFPNAELWAQMSMEGFNTNNPFPELVSETNKKNRKYCTWSGKLGSDHEFETFSFKGTREWAQHLAAVMGSENVSFFHDGLIVIRRKKKSYTTRHHIFGFITSYTRLNILRVMEDIVSQGGKLQKVILDGVYYTGCDYEPTCGVSINPSKVDDLKIHDGFADGWYKPAESSCYEWEPYDSRFDGNALLSGAGGCGKTHSVLTSRNLTDTLYVVPTHELGHGKHYATIHSLIGVRQDDDGKIKSTRNYKEKYGVPSNILIDEATMIPAGWIEKAINMYPQSQIFVAGDVNKDGQWFQTRNGCPGNFSPIWKPRESFRVVEYTTDYRALDDGLKLLKTSLRKKMVDVFTDGEMGDTMVLDMWIRTKMNVVSFDVATSMEDGIWIVGTHTTRKKLSDLKKVSKHGDREEAGFTVHSFQGQTIQDSKVYITLDTFEYAMLYTAISRVRKLDQIVLVEPPK